MGLGASSVSIPFQIADAGSMESMFSLCFGDMQGEGAIMFGDVPLPYGMKLQYVPLIFNKFHPHYYNINLQGMTIGNKKLNVAQVVPVSESLSLR